MVAAEQDETVDTAAGGTNPAEPPAEPQLSADERALRKLKMCRWLVLLSTMLALPLAMVAAVPTTDRTLWTLLVVTTVQFPFLIAASLVVAEPKRWAYYILLVGTPVSLVVLVLAISQGAWMMVPANVLIAAAFIPLSESTVRGYVHKNDRTLADIRAGR
ncbi:hypothetical protein [Saccharomonospora sp. CUA-673]|uniref:hypothetical protein n=1 Tax=Saccharomonospora sp. CUA-673 TaxID=1904969 RepID=UPI001C9E38D0|nr:hypothetical protein [Saccharomonospora sp. CUA-673]